MITIPVSNMHNLWANPSFPFGTGVDGPLTVNSNMTVNLYGAVNDDFLASAAGVTLKSGQGSQFTAGDEVMIIQMQTTRNGTIGQYEFLTIASVDADTINFASPLQASYYSDSSGNKTANTSAQIVTIPNYSSVDLQGGFSISADDWNGEKGGIAAFRCLGTFQGSGIVDVRNKGYRGDGSSGATPVSTESIKGLQDTAANGAGTWLAGAGGHATVGTAGSNGQAGQIYGSSDLTTSLTMGAGGGGGPNTAIGRDGGGIIFVGAGVTTFTGTLNANGTNGIVDGAAVWVGAGSAAGSAYLLSNSGSPTLSVNGGAGGNAINNTGGIGGDGYSLHA